MYIKPPGMAAAETADAKQQNALQAQQAKTPTGGAGNSDEGPKRHTRPKDASERGSGASPDLCLSAEETG